MPGCTAHADPDNSSCPERLGDTLLTRPTSPPFLFLQGGVDLSPAHLWAWVWVQFLHPPLGEGGMTDVNT